MILTINHETVYRYDSAATHSTQYLRLTPQDGEGQRVLEWRLELPLPAFTTTDSHGNVLHVLTLDMPHDEIRIRAMGIVETDEGERMSFGGGDPRPYLRTTPLTSMSPEMAAFAEDFRASPMTLDALERLAHAVHAWLAFDPAATQVSTPAAEAFALARGVCQDHAHVFIVCCRHLGVPARYVSGYVHSSGHRYDEHQASHAWAEVWLGDRWWSFDVVNRCRAYDAHLKLAVGMDYLDACPVRGVRRGGGTERMMADVRVMLPQAGMSEAQLRQAIEQQQQ
jgi:transglutaminase-like putative cysteine protease